MNVGDIMTQDVISVTPETSIPDAAKLMLNERVSGLPVITSSRQLVGILTEGDLLRRVEVGTERKRPHWLEFIISPHALAKEYVHSHARTVFDVMSRDIVLATEEMPVEVAVELMERKRVKRLPVVREGRVVGIISRANLMHVLAVRPQPAGSASDDASIRQRLEQELDKQPWGTRQFHFVVQDGIVDLWGFVTSDHQRNAMRVAAENVPGVKGVRDNLVWFEPYSGIIVSTNPDDRRAILH